MWRCIRKPDVVQVNRQVAKQMYEMPTVIQDRKLDEKRLRDHKSSLLDGSFRTPEWATCYCQETDTTYRVNGKHTSLLLSTIDPPSALYVTIQRYTADTYQDVVDLYLTFDRKIVSKRTADINRVVAVSLPGLENAPSTVVDVIVSGLAWHKWQERYPSIDPFVRACELRSNVEFALFAACLLDSGKTRRPLLRQGVLAAMQETFIKNEDRALVFWTLVRDDTGPSPESPDRKLARFLLVTPVGNGGGSIKAKVEKKKAATTREIYCKAIHAWNSWRRGERKQILKYMGDDVRLPAAV